MEHYILSCEVRPERQKDTAYLPAKEAGIRFTAEPAVDGGFVRKYRVSLRNESKTDFCGVIHVKAVTERDEAKFFLPGYIYNRNTADKPSAGRKAFPRVKAGGNRMPESEFWMTRSDRLAEPVSAVWQRGRVLAVAASPYWTGSQTAKEPADLKSGAEKPFYQYGGFTCSMNDGGKVSVGYTLGYENAPWLFIHSMDARPRAEISGENAFFLAAGEEVSFTLLVYDYAGEREPDVMRAVEDVYFRFHQSPREIGMTPEKAVRLLSAAIRDEAWLENEKMYTGFVYDHPGGNTENKIGSLSWTNGLAVAVPMLLAANRLNDAEARRQALTFLNEVVTKSRNPGSGLMYDAVTDGVWSVRGWWYDGMHSGGHSGYINGQAMYYILKAYVSEKKRGADHEDWLEFLRPMIAQLNRIRNTDGEYPFAVSEDTGAGIEYDSMGSAWCLAATAMYALVTGDGSYDEALRESEAHYYRAFVEKLECYGGPLDTDKAVDSEGILAYIRAARLLHERFGEAIYLRHLRDGIAYETTFKLGWNTPNRVRPFSEIGWSSCGGSITSTANPHIHPMSSTVIPEMRYLIEHAPDAYIESRLNDTVGWSLQTFNTKEKEYGYGRIGWMSERFCFCQGLMLEHYPDGEPAGTWFALMPWASGSIIEGLCGE